MTPKKRRGRPPLDPNDPSVAVCFRLPTKAYDTTLASAKGARLELADYLRLALRRINRRQPAS